KITGISYSPSTCELRFGRRERLNDLICRHDGAGVVWYVNVESGVHMVFRVIHGRVFYHRDRVADLSSKTNRPLDDGMRDKPDDDEPMDAVLFKLQIQIGVGKATGTPMLRGDNLTWLRLEPGTDLATPGAVFEAFSLPPRLLNGRDILPGLVVAGTV